MDNQTENQNATVSSDDRLLAMLAHLSIFLGGIILPIILWLTQKDKSKFVTFNSLQAIFYHIAYIVFIVLFVIIVASIMVLAGLGFAGLSKTDGGELPAVMIVMMIILYGGIFLSIFAGIGYAIYLAVKSYQGKIVMIPIIGKLVYKSVYGPK